MPNTERCETCGTCRFWSDGYASNAAFKAPEGFGECRKYAPRGPYRFGELTIDTETKIVTTAESVQSGFASTSKDDWCGEYQEQPK